MENREAQNEELLVLQSIYDEKYFKVESMIPPSGRYLADVQLPDPFYIKLKCENRSSNNKCLDCSTFDYEEFEVKYLPPIILYFEYPEGYPHDSPPAFLLSCSWLSHDQLSKLCKHFDILCNERNGEVILFQWIQFLREGTLNFLDIVGCLDITELSKYNAVINLSESVEVQACYNKNYILGNNSSLNSEQKCEYEKKLKFTTVQKLKPSVSGGDGLKDLRAFVDLPDGKFLKNILMEYNEFKETEHFQESWQLCDICFLNKKGSEFVIVRICRHFFCKDCIKSYFEFMITEGNIDSLKCPQDKCDTVADGTLVKQIVNGEMFERYDSLLLTRTLDSMSDIAHCPRKECQCPLVIDVNAKMGICPACRFVFCSLCKMAYHGIAPCIDKALEKKKKLLEENKLSENWKRFNSKTCPHCGISIEKTGGCNIMTCFKCGISFCWFCLELISHLSHYCNIY